MHTDDGVAQAVAHLGDGQRGGVGGENSLGLAERIQLVQQFLLSRHILLHALDHEVGVSAGGLLLNQNVGQQSVHSLLSHLALGNALGKRGGQLILMLLGGSHRACIHQSGMALRSENLSNAAAHGTGAENCNFHFRFLL